MANSKHNSNSVTGQEAFYHSFLNINWLCTLFGAWLEKLYLAYPEVQSGKSRHSVPFSLRHNLCNRVTESQQHTQCKLNTKLKLPPGNVPYKILHKYQLSVVLLCLSLRRTTSKLLQFKSSRTSLQARGKPSLTRTGPSSTAIHPACTFQQFQFSSKAGRSHSASPGSLRILPSDLHCTYWKHTQLLYTWVSFSTHSITGTFQKL